MDHWQPSTLSWSFSKKNHFDSCRRHYFYHRFWGQDPRIRWRLFEMRSITTLLMLRGQVVHSIIAQALNAAREGCPVATGSARENVTKVIREQYLESYHRLWHVDNRPRDRKASQITNLLEHYYNLPNTKERARQARDVASTCVENLLASDLWSEVMQSDTDAWRATDDDGFPSFDLDGIKVYARIDFAHAYSTPTIIDWKTGNPTPEDRAQLVLYALYAQAKWDWDPYQTTLSAVYLQPELRVESFSPSAEDIDGTIEGVKRSFNEMMEVEPPYGAADISEFPQADDPAECRWCRFQGICGRAERDAAACG